jgi:hypothetical protein
MSPQSKINPKILARNASIYGLWSDLAGMMEFKISPMGQYTRIKIMTVSDEAILDKISIYCGLKFFPRRANWRGFDFVTHLERTDEWSLKGGNVHMPRATRRTLVNVTMLERARMILDFNFVEATTEESKLYHAGSITLVKKMDD